MTVQSIDKRLTPDTNMTAAAPQGAQSVEDAFVALLQQTTQRFGNNFANTLPVGKLLSETVTTTHMELTIDRPPAARDDNPAPAAATPRPAKADRPRPAHAAPKKADANNDAPAASATADDTPSTVTTATDDGKPATTAKDDKQQADDGSDPSQQAQADPQAVPVVAVPVAQDQVVIEIDIQETVQVVQVPTAGTDAAAGAPAQASPDALLTPSAATPADAGAKDPLAGLSPEDRQRVADLQQKIMADLSSGDANDALDAATQLVSTLIDKTNLHQMAAGLQAGGKSDATQAQAQDLANMVAGSGVSLDIKVQTNQTAAATDPTTQNAATAVNAMAQMDLAAQGQQGANAGSDQTGQQNNTPDAQVVDPSTLAAATDAATAAPVVDETRTFSTVLAAQIEATAPATEQPAQQQPVAALAAVGATQATDKTGSAQTAAQTARAPRVPLQQQVMNQVTVQIDKAVKDGVDTVKIQLKPLDLGKIEIKLEVVDGRVSTTVTADKPETLALLQRDSKGLEKALEDAGLKPEPNSTSFNLRGGEQQQNADRGNNNQRSGRGRGRGAGLAPDIAAIGATQGAQSTGPGARSGVDISV